MKVKNDQRTGRLPWYVIFMATLLIGTSAVVCADLVAHLWIQQSPEPDLSILLFLLGIGLFRRSQICLRLLIVLLTFRVLFIIGIGLLAIIMSLFWATSPSYQESTLLNVLGFSFQVGIHVYFIRKLNSNETFLYFENTEPANHKKGQFRLGSLLMLVLIVAIFLVRFQADDMNYHPPKFQTSLVEGIYISYGYRAHRRDESKTIVQYVVIEKNLTKDEKGRLESRLSWTGASSSNPNNCWFQLPSGENIRIPDDAQLYELNGDRIRKLQGNVDWPQLQRFLESIPKDPTIEDLQKYK